MPRNTVRQRLMNIMLLTSAAGIALTCIGFGAYEYLAARNRFQDGVLQGLQTLDGIVTTHWDTRRAGTRHHAAGA